MPPLEMVVAGQAAQARQLSPSRMMLSQIRPSANYQSQRKLMNVKYKERKIVKDIVFMLGRYRESCASQ